MRSPYEDGKSIKVYLEDDVVRVASEKKMNEFAAQHNDVEKYKTRQNQRMEHVDQKQKSKATAQGHGLRNFGLQKNAVQKGAKNTTNFKEKFIDAFEIFLICQILKPQKRCPKIC